MSRRRFSSAEPIVEAGTDPRVARALALVTEHLAANPSAEKRIVPGWWQGGSRIRMTMTNLGIPHKWWWKY